MTRGLIAKTVREVWLTTWLFAAAFGTFEALIAYILPMFDQALFNQWLQLDLVQAMFKAMLGTEVGDMIGPGIIASLAWVHPVALALCWAHGIMFCTRIPAGEVDRGTIDVLLGLPVSRIRVYVCESVVWLISGLFLMVAGFLGNAVGSWVGMSKAEGTVGHTFIILVNLYGLYVAVGAMACLISSWSDRRGRAVGIAFAVVLASYLLNSLAQFWQPARTVSFLNFQHYYRPLLILRDGARPTGDVLVLLGVAAVLWLLGGIIFRRRDICTV